MADFRKQLEEDFRDYKERFPHVPNIGKKEWAFNFWILDNIFSVDENVIEEYIIDYNDKGIDCYVWHEDQRDLYLIQNKYYADETKVSNDYIQNDFLTRSIGALEKGTYTRSRTLQDIYNKFASEPDFNIHFYLFVTNNTSKTQSVIDGLAHFNEKYASKRYDVKMFTLDDIQELYYQEPIRDKKAFKYTLQTINKGTILNVDNEAYRMTLALDAKYVLTPVVILYRLVKATMEKQYPLFDENIRDYLGATGTVNKKIVATLRSKEDRKNFFFYNNGITMIVNDISAERTEGTRRAFDVYSPQIVNGCQTVSSIYETLNSLPEATLDEEFKDAYVMIKILKIPEDDAGLKQLYRNIVTYNNSQNAINENDFTATKDHFKKLQAEFEWRGILIGAKQSDKHTYKAKYKTPTQLLEKSSNSLKLFGLPQSKNTDFYFVKLDKVLQAYLAFISTPQDAIQRKSKLLVDGSVQNRQVVEFIKNTEGTINELFNLYLLYKRAEIEQTNSEDGKNPNPFYLVYCFSHYECKGDISRINELLSTKEQVESIIKKYKIVCRMYYRKWTKQNPGREYNDMIKSAIDIELLDACKADAEEVLEESL